MITATETTHFTLLATVTTCVYPQIWILNVMAVQELQNERGHYAIAFLTTLLCNIINDTVVP